MVLRPPIRQAILAAAGLAVIVYSICVVLYAKTSPDVGFRCVFSREICQITRQPVVGPAMQEGDQVVAIGTQAVPTYLHFNRALQELRSAKPRRLLPADPEAADAELRAAAQHSPDTWGNAGYGRTVKLRFWRPSEANELTAWCQVTQEPATRVAYSLVWFALELVIFALGAVVYWRRPTDEAAALFFELCIFTVAAFMGGYHWFIIAASPPLVFAFACCGFMLPAVSLHFYLFLPRPKWFVLVYPRLTLLVVRGIPAVCTLGFLLLMAVTSWKFRLTPNTAEVLAQLESLLSAIKTCVLCFVVYAGVTFLACVASLVHSYRRARNDTERNQVKWILAAAVPSIAPIGYTLYLAATDRVSFALGGATTPMFLASLWFILAYAVSITRYKLMHVGAIINRSVVYVAISSAVALVYYVVVVTGSVLLGGRLGSEPSYQMLVVCGTVVAVLIALGWVRDFLQRVLDRRLYREKYRLDRAMRRLSDAVNDLVDPATVAQRMLDASAELLGIQRARAYLRQGTDRSFELAACLGPAPALTRLLPEDDLVARLSKERIVARSHLAGASSEAAQRELRALGAEVAHALEFDGVLVCVVLLGPKPTAEPFTPDEFAFIAALGQVTTLALHSVKRYRAIDELNRELQEKVEKISEQQRRITLLQSQLLSREPAANPQAGDDTAFAGISGSSPALRRTLELARKVAGTQSAVLIRGESGTGKELLARAIHQLSPRSRGPFVTVHCAALSQGLLESELFGHVKGAFTGAHRDREGRFEMAHRGTLLLDEIGDINLETQTKLLRVLQEMCFERVGSTQPVQVEVRVIAATHQNLEGLIAQGRFRADLFFRLNVISIRTPPLRERPEDIFELAVSFLGHYGKQAAKPIVEIDEQALDCLRAYSWPGNVRELENVIERAVVLADGPILHVEDLPDEVRQPARLNHRALRPVDSSDTPATLPFWASVERDSAASHRMPRTRRTGISADAELRRLHDALVTANGNKAEAARLLGVPRSTFFSKLRKYRIA